MRRGIDTSFMVAAEVASHPRHAEMAAHLRAMLDAGDAPVLTPIVLGEFVHIATDPRRFAKPLPVPEALRIAREWWEASETEQAHTDPDGLRTFFDWMTRHRLGRKRILDTMLAATLHESGVTSLLTLNPDDFRIFDCFDLLPATP